MSKRKPEHGGARPGAGRPRNNTGKMARPSIYLPASVVAYIKTLGAGNLSAGVMHLYEKHREGAK